MGARVYQLRVPAEAACLRPVRAFLASLLDDVLGDAAGSVVLALDEACANVVAHRTPQLGRDDIELRVEVHTALVRFRLANFCTAVEVPSIRPRDLAQVRPGGLGTRFIADIMDRVAYELEPERPGAMALLLEKRVPAGGRP